MDSLLALLPGLGIVNDKIGCLDTENMIFQKEYNHLNMSVLFALHTLYYTLFPLIFFKCLHNLNVAN